MRFLIILLLLAACSSPPIAGDFCDIAEPVHLKPELATMLVKTDRSVAVSLEAHNAYGEQFCGW